MFSLSYFWTSVFAFWFAWHMVMHAKEQNYRNTLICWTSNIGSLCSLAITVFHLLGFWFFPHWWYVFTFVLADVVTSIIPIPRHWVAAAGLIFCIPMTVLSYYFLFK
jgi:hypothetical protein